MHDIALPTGSYESADLRASCKRLVNIFSEIEPQTSPQDSKQNYPLPGIVLRRFAGIRPFADDGTNGPVRGLWEMAGIVYAVIGPTLYSVDLFGNLTQLGTGILGNSFVRMTDNTACLVILVPNTNVCYTYTVANGLAQLMDPVFLGFGAIDAYFCDSFIVFLAQGGRQFYNDDGQAVSGQGPITFTTNGVFPREFGTDPFVGFTVDHREPIFLGRRTSEGYINAGNPVNSPFSSAPDSFIQMGCHPDAAYSIAAQDQAFFWIANDRTVRRRNGQTPLRVSNSGIENILQDANLSGSYAITPTVAGHPLWACTLPKEGRTIVYDCLTQEWFELESHGLGNWRPLCYLNAFGEQLVGDSASGKIGVLDTATYDEFGIPLVGTMVTQSVYHEHNRLIHRRLEALFTSGEGIDLAYSPKVTLFSSDDSGYTFDPRPMRGMGNLGQRKTRLTWFNLGQSRDRVYKFEFSDPALTFTVDLTASVQECHW